MATCMCTGDLKASPCESVQHHLKSVSLRWTSQSAVFYGEKKEREREKQMLYSCRNFCQAFHLVSEELKVKQRSRTNCADCQKDAQGDRGGESGLLASSFPVTKGGEDDVMRFAAAVYLEQIPVASKKRWRNKGVQLKGINCLCCFYNWLKNEEILTVREERGAYFIKADPPALTIHWPLKKKKFPLLAAEAESWL